jgi:peptide/nickel transport system permease protein
VNARLTPAKGYRLGHILGTDHLGRDVLAGIIRGCFNSLKIGLFAIAFSVIIGLLIGCSMAYFGNTHIKVSLVKLISILLVMLLGIFYIYYIHSFIGKAITFILILSSIYIIVNYFRLPLLASKLSIPIDTIFNSMIILRKSIPTLLLILACIPLFSEPRTSNIIILLSLIGWTNIARHTRAESISILQKEYVQSARLMGAGFWHIFRYHIIPLITPTIGVVAGFAFGSFLVIETSLSYLGIGLPPDDVSWGSMIGIVRSDLNLWWVALFPSLILFIIIYSFNTFFDSKSNTEIGSFI